MFREDAQSKDCVSIGGADIFCMLLYGWVVSGLGNQCWTKTVSSE